MNNEYICPCCGKNISDFVAEEIKRHTQQRVAQKMREGITPERRAEMNAASRERIKKWRAENPDKSREYALNASRSRTAETFARQRETIKDTARRKTLKFAELLFEEQKKGVVITPEVENSLMQKAREIIKEENKSRKKAKTAN